jgi:hypothetical protein
MGAAHAAPIAHVTGAAQLAFAESQALVVGCHRLAPRREPDESLANRIHIRSPMGLCVAVKASPALDRSQAIVIRPASRSGWFAQRSVLPTFSATS